MWPTVALFARDENQVESGIILSTLLAFGPVAEVFQVFVGAYLIRLTGVWLGGKAGVASIQTAIAWGNVPIAVLAILGVVLLTFSGVYAELSDAPLSWGQSSLVTGIAWALFVFQAVIVAWSVSIFLRGLVTVQGYSMGRAIANTVFAWMIPATLVVLAAIILGYADKLLGLFFAGFEDLVFLNEA